MSRETELLERALAALAAAPGDRHSPWRHLQLATVSRTGGAAVRTVVLRAFDRDRQTLQFHADRRSPKIADIAAAPAVELLAWAAPVQARLRGHARLVDGAAAWAALSPAARSAYTLAAEPGTPVDEAAAAARVADGFEQFAVVEVAIGDIDVLELGEGGAQLRVRAAAGDARAQRIGP